MRVRRPQPALPEPPLRARSPRKSRVRHLQLAPPQSVSLPEEPELSEKELGLSIVQRAAEARAKLHALCRTDVNALCEYVLRDDATGIQIEQTQFHLELQETITVHRQVVVVSHPESGKTTQIVGRVLFELGNNPNIRVMLLYNAEEAASNTLSSIKKYIEESKELHAVFPALRRGPVWKDDSIVIARSVYDRNPSVVAVGYNSRRIQGSRVDFLVVDDLLDQAVTATESQRRKLSSWVKSTVFTRLTENAPVAFLTNAWHPRDLAHELVKDRGWHLIKRPIRNPDGAISWSKWTEQRLKLKRKDLGALEYARSFECNPRDEGSRVFPPEHVEFAKARGRGYGFVRHLDAMPDNCLVITGVDLAAGEDVARQGARTAIASVFFHKDQTRQLVRIRSGRWRATQILQEVALVSEVFPDNHWIVVENNGVQQYIVDLALEQEMDFGVALLPFQTGRNKRDPRFGVASMAAEFESRRWVLPADCSSEEEQEEVESFIAQCIDYVPEAHTGDTLMAVWMAREIGRKIFERLFGRGASKGSIVRAIG